MSSSSSRCCDTSYYYKRVEYVREHCVCSCLFSSAVLLFLQKTAQPQLAFFSCVSLCFSQKVLCPFFSFLNIYIAVGTVWTASALIFLTPSERFTHLQKKTTTLYVPNGSAPRAPFTWKSALFIMAIHTQWPFSFSNFFFTLTAKKCAHLQNVIHFWLK